MEKVLLGDVLDVQRGASLSGEFYSESGNRIRLTLGNFNYPSGGFKKNTSKKDIYFTGPINPKFILKKGDLITPLTEQVAGLLGTTAFIPEDDVYIQSGDIGLVTTNENRLLKGYAYYLLNSSIIKRQLGASAQQTKIRHTSPDAIKSCFAWIPSLDQQLRITNILGTIDKQIELYKKKYEIIDEFSRLIYDLWFVQYDYLCNGKPYKSSDGQIVWNKELKAYIPLDWQVVSLSECIKSINTGLNPRKNFVLNNGSNKYITVKNLMANGMIDFENCDTVSDDAMRLIHRRSDIRKEDILFASIEPLGRAYLLLEDPIDWDINESVFSLRVEKERISPYFLYFYLRSNDIIKKMEQSSTGSVFKGIRISVINDMKIALPNKITLHLFDDIVGPLVHEQKKIEQSIKTLAHQKRVILPLLMNGQAHLN